MKPPLRFSAKTLTALSAAVGELYKPATRAEFPAQLVHALESFFGSDIVTYNEFPADGGAPFVVSNNGFVKEYGALLEQCAPWLVQNPLIAKLFEQRSLIGTRISDMAPMAEYQRTDIYNEWYRVVDADYQLGCGFPAEERDVLFGLALNQKDRDFTDRERFLFNLLIPHARQAYQVCRAMDRARREAGTISRALDDTGSGIIVFNDGCRVARVTPGALRLAEALFRCAPREGAVLPVELRGCVQRLHGASGGELPETRRPLRFALPDGGTVTLRLSHDPEGKTHGLILEHERGVPDENELQALGLTRREAEVVRWMLQDKTNWEIGVILGISSRTVEKHAERIFTKLGIADRRQLAGRMRETVA